MPEKFDYNSIPVGYYDAVYHLAKGIQSKWHHLKFAHILEILPRKGRHCDIGCAAGTFIGTCNYSELSSTGVDISDLQINYAKEKYHSATKKFMTTNENFDNLPSESFDIITIIELIEHLSPQDIEKLLVNAEKILKPDGKIILTTPNYASLYPIIEFFVNKLGKVSYEEQHITKLTPKKLRAIIPPIFQITRLKTNLGFAPFSAFIHWNLADFINKIEAKLLNHLNYGNIIICELQKSTPNNNS